MFLNVTRMYPYVFVCTRVLLVCYSYALECYLYGVLVTILFNANVFSELAVHTENKVIIFVNGPLQDFRHFFR